MNARSFNKASSADVTWSVELARPGQPNATVTALPGSLSQTSSLSAEIDNVRVTVDITPRARFTEIDIEAACDAGQALGYLVLRCRYTDATPYTFLGEAKDHEIYRQSPHDPADHRVDIAKQAVPMIAVKTGRGFVVAVSDNPAACDNYTTQEVDPAGMTMALTSGDSGQMPGHKPHRSKVEQHYHTITPSKSHRFQIILLSSPASDLLSLRRDVLDAISARWGGPEDHFGAVAFASNYMNYRQNETGTSDFWVCPGVEYANKQYSRDAFWQSLVFPLEMEQQCYNAEANGHHPGAERPIFGLIWSDRIRMRGGTTDMDAARWFLDYVEAHTRDSIYCAYDVAGKKDFQSWYDVCAFEPDDVISYNQGLLAVALMAAQRLELSTRTQVDDAVRAYRQLFLQHKGYYPLSRKKDAVCVDALVGDVLAQVLYDRPLLDSEAVRRHYDTIMTVARTPHGFKVTCDDQGRYLTREFYDAEGFLSRSFHRLPPGRYTYGGAWYLYDMLCLMDCHLHGVAGAEEQMIWRTKLEFEAGGTYHEYIDTSTGEPGKPNYGWNAAVYGLWRILMDKGVVSQRFFRAVNDAVRASKRGQ